MICALLPRFMVRATRYRTCAERLLNLFIREDQWPSRVSYIDLLANAYDRIPC